MQTVQLRQHIGKRKQKIKYIVIHDTGNTSAGAGANAHKNYFLTTDRKASADFVVEDDKIIKLNNYEKYFTWHCGDGGGKYGITNSNSIGIEMCVNSDANRQKTINTTIELVFDLMEELKIPLDRVIRHYDASRKICPASMRTNDWEGWKRFKAALKEFIEMKKSDKNLMLLKLGQKSAVYETVLTNGFNFIKIRDLLDFLGYEIESYSSTEIVIKEQSKG